MECSCSDIFSRDSLIRELEERNKEQTQTILELQSLLQVSQSRNTELETQITVLETKISEFEIKIAELEARLGLHSGNSSFPPSRDFAPPPKPITLRKKSGRKAGGQKNVKA